MGVLFALAIACGGPSSRFGSRDAASTLAILQPFLARLPHGEALERAPDDANEDDASRGRIVSAGWRATRKQRFDGLGARLPDAASGTLEVGPSRFVTSHVHVVLDDASPRSEARLRDGAVVYVDALASTDRVMIGDTYSLEELLVLHDARAPRAFTWKVHLSEGLARITANDGALRFEDANGRAKLAMSAPRAWDARGAPVSLAVSWSDRDAALTVTLPANELAYPVIVDPKYETSAWFDTALRLPPARSFASLAFDQVRNELVLFGGQDAAYRVLGDTWTWDGVSPSWTQRARDTAPPPRLDASMTYDSARREIVLFGGYALGTAFNDTWVWSGATGAWTQRFPRTSPAAREGAALAFDPARSRMVLFGGLSPSSFFDDTWVWDGTDWTQITPFPRPTQRSSAAMAFDPVRSELVLYGGVASGGVMRTDTWTWDGTTWTDRSATTAGPTVPGSHAMVLDGARNELVLYAGAAAGVPSSAFETWVWTGSNRRWAQRSPATSPVARAANALAYDSVHQRVTVVGGFLDASTVTNDVWLWDGATWTKRLPSTAPSARVGHGMAFDAARGVVTLFGGFLDSNAAVPSGETWAWSGASSSWSRLAPATSPSARGYVKLAYDAARREIVLFGGAIGGIELDETWTWNGATWEKRSPAHRPPAQAFHAMTYDPARAETVLVSGRLGFQTHTWNGSDWTTHSTPVAPSARYGPALAYDASVDRVVLFGGSESDEVWFWDGAMRTWQPKAARGARPTGRNGHVLVEDPTRGELVMFGGTNLDLLFRDTWTWSSATSTWTQRTPITPPRARTVAAATWDATQRELVLFGGLAVDPLGDLWIHRTLGGTCSTNAECLDSTTCVDGVCCLSPSCGSCETCAGTTPGRCSPVLNTEDDTCAVADGKSCSNVGECLAALGAPATDPKLCASAHVVDGVCCATASCGACESCNPAQKEQNELPGVCSATKSGTDPHDDCMAAPPENCGLTGQCDGRRRCAFYGPETQCGGNGVCSGAGACIPRDTSCDGDHTVLSSRAPPENCAPYRCVGATCLRTCVSRVDCVSGFDCTSDGRCVDFGGENTQSNGCSVAIAGRHGVGNASRRTAALAWPLALALAALGGRRVLTRRRPRFLRAEEKTHA